MPAGISLISFSPKQLPENRQAGIGLGLAITGAVIQVLAAPATQAFAVLFAEKLRVHVQYKCGSDNVRKIRAIIFEEKRPFVRILCPLQFVDQNGPQRIRNLPQERLCTAVTYPMQRCFHRTFQKQDTGAVSYAAFCSDRLLGGAASAKLEVTQVQRPFQRAPRRDNL